MATVLPQLRQRIEDLDRLADEVSILAERLPKGDDVQRDLSIKGQQWYRGARELMVQNGFSGVDEFDDCYKHYPQRGISGREHLRSRGDMEVYFTNSEGGNNFHVFRVLFMKARSLVGALEEEILSRELPVKSQLSFAISTNELETAESILTESKGEEVLIRASGVVARVALERHLFTVAETRKVTVTANPPKKRHPDVEDVMQSLQRNGIITAIQKSQLDSLFKVANNCAHPKEVVKHSDVERLIRDGRQLASLIL